MFRSLVALFALVVVTTPLHALVVTSTPTRDAFVTTGSNGSLSGNNYGMAGALGVAASGLSKGEFQTFMIFDASSSVAAFNSAFGAGQWTITSITLTLTSTNPNNGVFNSPSASGSFKIDWISNDSWTEGTGMPMTPDTTGASITYTNSSSLLTGSVESQGTFLFPGGTSGTTTYTLTPTSGLLGDMISGGQIGLHLSAADSSIAYLFNSGNFGTASAWPVLSITAVPEPSTIAMVGVALAFGVYGLRRRIRA